jgi:aspartate/methionine/tyrosine aminotransferase
MFKDGKFNIDALEEKMSEEAKSGSVRVLLNFPQNPSGYSPTTDEVKRLVEFIKGLADKGVKVMVWCDDAYFGLAYETEIERQSLFAYLADLSPNVLAAKIDGPTKEDFAWGFRCGFITFACKGMTEEQYDALVKKLMGTIRSSVSCSSTPPQNILLKAFQDPKIEEQKAAYFKVLEKRYQIVKNFVNTHKSDALYALPFNSGYFMSFHLNSVDAEALRKKLLEEKGIGTIAIDSQTLRIAFSSLDDDKIEMVYSAIYESADELARA